MVQTFVTGILLYYDEKLNGISILYFTFIYFYLLLLEITGLAMTASHTAKLVGGVEFTVMSKILLS